MNNIVIHGRLTRDPELKYVNGDTAVCNFSVAVDKYGEGTNFFNCVAWRKMADMVNTHFHKGKEIIVLGSMEMDVVEKDGDKRTYWKLNASRIDFCGKKDDKSSSSNTPNSEPQKTAEELYQQCVKEGIPVEEGKDREYYLDKLDDVPF